MITLILAFINAKYNADYHFLFGLTFFLDFSLIVVTAIIFSEGGK